jgi:hypothetical protein
MLLRYDREGAWAALVSFLGLPADPTWADQILAVVEQKKRIEEIDGIGCQPVLISATTEEVLEWIGNGLRAQTLAFPERNGSLIGRVTRSKQPSIPDRQRPDCWRIYLIASAQTEVPAPELPQKSHVLRFQEATS